MTFFLLLFPSGVVCGARRLAIRLVRFFVILFTLGVKRDKDTCVPSVLCLWEKDHQSSADQLTNSQDKTSNLENIKVWSLELAKREMKRKKMDAAAYKIISWLVL